MFPRLKYINESPETRKLYYEVVKMLTHAYLETGLTFSELKIEGLIDPENGTAINILCRNQDKVDGFTNYCQDYLLNTRYKLSRENTIIIERKKE